jgi:hypothetical protein
LCVIWTVVSVCLLVQLAGTPAIVTVTARDSNRRRITEGGDEVSVIVHPGLGCGKDAEPVTADITDRGDGSYVAKFTVPCKGNWKIRVEVEGIEVDGSPFPVFFGAPGSLDVKEAEKAAEEAVAAAAPGGAAAAGTVALDAAGGASGGPAAAPKVLSSAFGSAPYATPASIAAASAGNPLAAAAAAAAAFSMPNAAGGLGLGGVPPPNPMTAAMASAAAAAAAGATFVNPLAANPLHQQLALQLLAAKLSPDVHTRCVVVTQFPPGLDAAALRTLMAVTGTVVDVALTGTPGEGGSVPENDMCFGLLCASVAWMLVGTYGGWR